MCNILVNGVVVALGALRVVYVPKDREPFVEEGGIGGGHGQLRWRQIFGELGVDVVLGVRVHGVVADTVDQIAVLVATTVRAVLEHIDRLAAGQKRTGTLVHVHADKVLVDVCVENAALVFICLLLARRGGGGGSGSSLGVHDAVVHHGHGGTANRAAHGVHVGHVDVWIHGRGGLGDDRRRSSERPKGSAAAATMAAAADGGSCSHGDVPPGGAALGSLPTWT